MLKIHRYTDDGEIARICRAVYARYQKEPEPTINFFMVILMVALGAAVVIGIPRLMKRCERSTRLFSWLGFSVVLCSSGDT